MFIVTFWQNTEGRVVLQCVFMTSRSLDLNQKIFLSNLSPVTQFLLTWLPGILAALFHFEVFALNVSVDEFKMKYYQFLLDTAIYFV